MNLTDLLKCPKCGSEMETRLLHENPEGTGRSMLVWYCQNCGHEEKVETDDELREETERLFRKLHEPSNIKYGEEKVQ